MKTRIILFILSIYLISGTGLREIVKLPVLFQHFYEHKLLNQQITFADYLSDHYNAIPHTDNDEERDNQLPFKTLDSNSQTMPAMPQWHRSCLQRPIPAIVINDTFLYRENFIPAPDCGQIWQPPKA